MKQGAYQADALQRDIVAKNTGEAILIWIRSKPRVTTLRPVAERLTEAGMDVYVAIAPAMQITPEEMQFSSRVRIYDCPAARVEKLRGIAVFITSEQTVMDGPVDALRIGIHHSLPDGEIKRDYARMLAHKPTSAVHSDYYAILVCQEDENWTVENYQRHVDQMFPPSLLKHRRPTLSIIPFGYPKIDQMMAYDTSGDTLDTLTYAPTQSTLSFGDVLNSGSEIIAMLLEKFPDYKIAFRPYPGGDVERTRHIYTPFLNHERFEMDVSPTGEALTRRTALLVSDRSSMAVSFGLGYGRPVVTFRPSKKSDGAPLIRFPPIGLHASTFPALHEGIAQLLADADVVKKRVAKDRARFIYNPGRSLDYLVEVMPDILAGRSRPEWLEIPRRPFLAWSIKRNRTKFEELVASVRKINPDGVEATIKTFEDGFDNCPERSLRQQIRQIVRRIPGLRRDRSRP